MKSKQNQQFQFDDKTEQEIARAKRAFMPSWNQQCLRDSAHAIDEILKDLPARLTSSSSNGRQVK